MLNLSPLFNTTSEDKKAFLDNLELTLTERATLMAARKEVRGCLKEGIPVALRRRGFIGDVPSPKFFTQGSWSYATINSPARVPQQADLDDGVYLPMTFVQHAKRPSHAAKWFFDAAEDALQPLCDRNNWKVITDKPTCIRIELSDRAHIDIPLYAIPDDQFVMLKASIEARGYALDEAVMRQDVWTALPVDEVLLAHRDEDWKKSDPRPLKEWFEGEVEARGEQLRRVIRYLKAFRDWQWRSGGPSSILLMAVAGPLFEKQDGRDDLALLDVLEKLPSALRDGVNSPTDQNESLTDRLGSEGIEEAAKKFENFHLYLRGAVDCSNPAQACAWLVETLGGRFPNEPTWVRVPSARETVAATAALAGPSEIVGTTKSA